MTYKAFLLLSTILITLFFKTSAQNEFQVIYSHQLSKSFLQDAVLIYDGKASLYTYNVNLQKKSTNSEVQNDGTNTSNRTYYETDSIGIQIQKKKGTSYVNMRRIENQPYLVKDEINFDWEFQDSSKMIGQLKCQLAKTTFRGREYEAWYCPKFPVAIGPWKFHGLPGLICEVKDRDGMVFLKINKISFSCDNCSTQINIPEKQAISFQDFRAIRAKNTKEKQSQVNQKAESAIAKLKAEFPGLIIKSKTIEDKSNVVEIFD